MATSAAGPSYTSKVPAGIQHAGAGTLFAHQHEAPSEQVWDGKSVMAITRQVSSLDELLERGIGDYTFVAGGTLGKGKFSAVYRVTDKHGNVAALKHTPLYPHHPLISSRLLREPTLLAQIPPYPNLIGVQGWLRTPDGFYLIEDLPEGYVPLPQLAADGPLDRHMAKRVLDQLVSVVRDGLHEGARVCHRDLKGENCLVHPDTGDVVLLDLGLATHYSASKPKLTTCCGSPAFHSPEIVDALNQPPGAVTYYGPELDIWCIALTVLSLLLAVRFPLGPTHKSVPAMRERVREALIQLDRLYPREMIVGHDRDEWERVRCALRDFLEIDAKRRMTAFKKYDVGAEIKAKVKEGKRLIADRKFKSTTFVPTEVKYTLPLFLVDPVELDPAERTITFRNPTDEDEKRVNSYIKYLLRSAGILYHSVPTADKSAMLQIVLPLATAISAPTSPSGTPKPAATAEKPVPQPFLLSSLLSPLVSRKPPLLRSVSVPIVAKPSPQTSSPAGPGGRRGKDWAIQAWLRVETRRACCERRKTPESSGSDSSPRRSRVHSPGMPLTPILGMTGMQCEAALSRSRMDAPRPEAESTVIITLSDPRIYHVIRDALAVHVPPTKAPKPSKVDAERGRRRSREEEITIVSPDRSPVIVPEPTPDKSKRSESAETIIAVEETDEEKPVRVKRNSPQRGRKQGKKSGGLLEELFGNRMGNWARPGFGRAASVPPGGVIVRE